MLSIGKLATGQAGYYLEQADGSVSRAAAVSSGVEDSYLGGPEAAGAWDGFAAAVLGLTGEVDAASMNRVLSGEHPATAVPLGRVLSSRRPGFDLELPGRRVRLDAGHLDSATRHGLALQHPYAITGHVAQGLTFRQTFVLATDRISREWGYSALSRGSEANRLYAVDAHATSVTSTHPPTTAHAPSASSSRARWGARRRSGSQPTTAASSA